MDDVFSGIEVYMQVSIQVLILMLSQSETATTQGLQTIFNQTFLGIDATTVLWISISWSLLSCARMHTKLIALEKGFCKISSKFFIFLWGCFATLRRVLSVIAMFIPSMGLFSILHHWRWEQIPFRARLEYAKRGFLQPDDKIGLFGLKETIYWTQLDRWSYADPQDPQPPPYSLYTLMSLKDTLAAGAILLAVNFLALVIVKLLTSAEFRSRGNIVNKLIHILENINYAAPYEDWDVGDYSIDQFRVRFQATCKEMLATFAVNIVFTMTMLVPLWHTGQCTFQFLAKFLGI